MEKTTSANGLSARVIATFIVILSSIALVLTGVVMFFRPKWASVPGVYRGVWNDWHIALSIMFVIAAGIHLSYNWKPLLRYMGKATERARAQKREMVVACALFGLVTVAVFMQLLPFESLKGEKHGPPAGARGAEVQTHGEPRGDVD